MDPNLFSLVVVEGGPKAIKFYKNLMLKRIKWDTLIKKVFINIDFIIYKNYLIYYILIY